MVAGLKPVLLPKFNPEALEYSAGLRLGARKKVRIAWLQREREDRVRELNLCWELELRKLEAYTAIRMRELQLKARANPVSVS